MARTAQERFSTPHVALTGANQPGTRRLYELIVGLSNREAAGKCSTTPAIADRNTSGRLGRLVGWLLPTRGEVARSAGGAVANAFLPSFQNDKCTCPLDPSSPGAVLARKLARSPMLDARSFTAIFVSAASSAARSAGRAPRFSSRRPGPASVCTARRSTPSASRAWVRARTNASKPPSSDRL